MKLQPKLKNNGKANIKRTSKQIALEISKRWNLVNRVDYYNVIDTKTGQSSIEGGDKNFASYSMYCKIEMMYLQMIGENALYFDWQPNGVEVSNNRKNYVFKINDEVVRLLCGFKIQKIAE